MSISKNKISVITINYNSTEKVQRLIRSLNIIDEIIDEILLIDNNSINFNSDEFKHNKKTKIIINTNNFGFSKAVNQGIKLARNKIVLLINPDCEINDKTPIKTFKLILDNKYIGAAGGKIIDTNTKKIQFSATSKPTFCTGLFEFTNLKKLFPNNKYSKNFWIENKHFQIPTMVFSLCGAYMFLRVNNKSFLNEDYFMYMEDLDYGYIMENNMLEVWFDPRSSISHIGGSSNRSKYHIVLKYWYKSRKLFFLKHLNFIQGIILYLIFQIEEYLLTIYHYITHKPNE